MEDFLQYVTFIPFVDFSRRFEHRYQGEKLKLECRLQCAVWTFNTLPAAVLGAL